MKTVSLKRRVKRAWGERGYALLALLASLTIMLTVMSAAVPAFQHDIQREREEEMFWRGQQVSWALSRYARTLGRYPNKLEDLTEKIQTPTGEMRFMRISALCDPMVKCPNEESKSGDGGTTTWRLVRRGDPLIAIFYQAYMAAQLKSQESGKNKLPPAPAELQQLAATQGGTVRLPGSNEPQKQEGPPDSEFGAGLKSEGPIYGVVSNDGRAMIRNYFDLGNYDQALFFSGVTVSVPGFINPIAIVAGAAGGSKGPDPRCPNGGLWFEQDGKGYCAGVVNQGQLCRGPDGQTIPCPKK